MSQPPFVRGNCDGDAFINISDPIFLLGYMFSGGSAPNCFSACDIDDDGALQISDPIYPLFHLFVLGSPPPPPPFPDLGPDPTPDTLTCG